MFFGCKGWISEILQHQIPTFPFKQLRCYVVPLYYFFLVFVSNWRAWDVKTHSPSWVICRRSPVFSTDGDQLCAPGEGNQLFPLADADQALILERSQPSQLWGDHVCLPTLCHRAQPFSTVFTNVSTELDTFCSYTGSEPVCIHKRWVRWSVILAHLRWYLPRIAVANWF